MALPTLYHSRSTRLVAGLAATAAAILCVSVLAILWVLGTSSSAMDRAQNEGQTRLVRAIVKTRLVRLQGKGLSARDAYALSSIGVDFGIAEAVDVNLAIYGKVPKSYFKKKTPYWRA